jgi:tetratricopeptide (TPR) repeat protein
LLHSTRERAWGRRFPELIRLRQAQASAAFNRAIALEPDYALAHYHLGLLYQEMGYLDLAVHHLQTCVDLTHVAGPPPGASPEEIRQGLDRLAKEVKRRENRFAADSAGKPILDRALLARNRGLAGKARDLLLQSDIAAFGDQGMQMELELLVNTGRAADVWGWTAPEHQAALGPAVYRWLRGRAFAATGDYARAAQECNQLGLGLDPKNSPAREIRGGMVLLIAQALLTRNAEQDSLRTRLSDLAVRLRRMADWSVLRGLIALEQGDTAEASASFRDALAIWKDEPTAASGGSLDFNGRIVAQQCLRWLE